MLSRLFAIWLTLVGILVIPALLLADTPEEDTGLGLYLTTKAGPVALPLASTRVDGTLRGFVAEIAVTQVYLNPYTEAIEATYVFPLPEHAAVNHMVMMVGEREIVAEIEPREEAERIYKEALEDGHTAALMTQERPNVFTQRVGNIPPGHKVEVRIEYVEVLPYREGISTLVFPAVVGPRFIPGQPLDGADLEPSGRSADTDQVTDASRITPPALGPGEVTAHRIDLDLLIDPGLPIRKLSSPSHQIDILPLGQREARIRLAEDDRYPNKDFVLHIDLRAAVPAATLLSHRTEDGDGFLTLAVQPPARLSPTQVSAKDLFFVIDNSGSMHGAPLDAAKALVRLALQDLNPDDRFTVMRFSDAVSELSATPLENNPENVAAGVRFVDAMQGMGGTNMLSGIRQALAGQPEAGRVRIVFFLTDGYIGNDEAILGEVATHNHARARLFSLGVGSSVNRYLLAGMARLGRGQLQVMRHDQDPGPFVQRFYRQVRNPVLTEIQIDWGGLDVEQQSPRVTGDLFDGQPLLVHARYGRPGAGVVTVRGYLGRELTEQQIEVVLPERVSRPAVAQLWARARIGEWMDEESVRPGSHRADITEMAISHNLMSKYTAFVAVDRERVARRPVEPLIPVAQRLPLPDGVSRRALGDLSRHHIPPGDPIITVAAPADARRVTAYFPFGLIKDLHHDPLRDIWRGRFLVPAGIPDGSYHIVVAVETADGRVHYHRETYHLDSAAADFFAGFDRETVRPGEQLDLFVDSVEPAAEVYVHCQELAWDRHNLSWIDGREEIDWETLLTVPADAAPGLYEVLVVIRDLAGNRAEQTIELTVLD